MLWSHTMYVEPAAMWTTRIPASLATCLGAEELAAGAREIELKCWTCVRSGRPCCSCPSRSCCRRSHSPPPPPPPAVCSPPARAFRNEPSTSSADPKPPPRAASLPSPCPADPAKLGLHRRRKHVTLLRRPPLSLAGRCTESDSREAVGSVNGTTCGAAPRTGRRRRAPPPAGRPPRQTGRGLPPRRARASRTKTSPS